MGLNEAYTTMRGSILIMKPLPSLAQAFSLLVQQEKQREVKLNNQLNLESTSLQVNAAPSPHQNRFGARNFKTHYMPTIGVDHFVTIVKGQAIQRKKYYKLHRYPQNNSYKNQNLNRTNTQQFNQGNNSSQTQGHKFNRGKGVVANVHGVPADLLHEKKDDPTLHGENQNVSLTKEQYGQIMNLLQQFQTGEGSPSNANITSCVVNFAGPFSEEASSDWQQQRRIILPMLHVFEG